MSENNVTNNDENNSVLKKQQGKGPICCINRVVKKALCKCTKDKKPVVTVVRLSGAIGEGGTLSKGLCLNAIEEDLEKAFNKKIHKNLKAVALQINSPGGSPVQSELIFNKIRSLSEEKQIPVYSFAEDVAASGGYWLLCAGDEAYAHGSSIVGSIGVIAASFGFVDAIKKIGVERRIYTQGENKSILDPFVEEDQKSVDILKSCQKDIHEEFKNLVKSRRGEKIDPENNPDIFSGMFYTGIKGKELGLIDDVDNLDNVIKNKFGKDVKFIKVAKPKGWIKRKLSTSIYCFVDAIVKVATEKKLFSRFGM